MPKINPEQLVYFYIVGTNTIFSRTFDNFQCVVSNPDYISLSEAQTTYYLSCPEATLHEVLACYQPEAFDLEDYKKTMVEKLDYESLERYKALMPEYKVQNAQISIACPGQDAVYTALESSEVIANANRLAKLLRDERYRIFELIQSSISKDEVDSAFNSAIFKNIQ